MNIFCPRDGYGSHLTPEGRARTIAAFHVAQGDVEKLSAAEMRRDVLTALMSKSAVNYWLNDKGWLDKSRKLGNVQMLRLTVDGLSTCSKSLCGLAEVNTDSDSVANKRLLMTKGGPGYTKKEFADIHSETSNQ